MIQLVPHDAVDEVDSVAHDGPVYELVQYCEKLHAPTVALIRVFVGNKRVHVVNGFDDGELTQPLPT